MKLFPVCLSFLLCFVIPSFESLRRSSGLLPSIRFKNLHRKNLNSLYLHKKFIHGSITFQEARRFPTILFGRKGKVRIEESSSNEDDDSNESIIREMKLDEEDLDEHISINSKHHSSHKKDRKDVVKPRPTSLTEEDFEALMHPDFLRAAQKFSDKDKALGSADISQSQVEEEILDRSVLSKDHGLVFPEVLDDLEQSTVEEAEDEDEEDEIVEVEEIDDVEDEVVEDVLDVIEDVIEDNDNSENTDNEEEDDSDEDYDTVDDRDTRDSEDYTDNNIDTDDDPDSPSSVIGNNNNKNNNYDENETDYDGDSYSGAGPYGSGDEDVFSEDGSYSHDSDTERDTIAEDADNDPFENEYWRLLQRWEMLEFWDPERAAMIGFQMTQAMAEDQARRQIYTKLPETAFYRLYSGKERAIKRLKINRQQRQWKRKLLHARLTFKARCDAHRIARESAASFLSNNSHSNSDNRSQISKNDYGVGDNLGKTAKENEQLLLLEENLDEEDTLIDEYLHTIDPDDETTYLVYSDKCLLGHCPDPFVINETLVQERYLKRLEAFQELQHRLNASRVSQDKLRREFWNKLYLSFIPHPLDNSGDTPETQRESRVATLDNITEKTEKEDKTEENIDETDNFYEDFYVDQYDDRVETHRLQDTTFHFLKRLRDKLLMVNEPATRLMTQLQIVKHSVSKEEHDMLRRVSAYWKDTYVSRYFFNRDTARQSEYDRVAQLYNYSETDTYETQLQKRVAYDQRRFRLVAHHIEKTQNPEYRDKRLVVNETHAVMYIPTHLFDQDTSFVSQDETLDVYRGENETVVVMRDYFRDNDDGVLVCPPTDEDVDRVNENNYRVVQEYAKRFYSHLSPTHKAPFGDPFESLAWHQTRHTNRTEQSAAAGHNGSTVSAPPSSDETDRPVLFIRALFSNFTGTGDTMLNMTHAVFDAIRRHTNDTPQIQFDIFVLERNASDQHRFFHLLTPLQRDEEVQMLREQMKRVNRMLGASYEDTERHLETRLPMEDMLHIWCEGHNVHHLLDGFTMVKLWGEMKPEIVLAEKNLQAIVSQVWYALHIETQSHAVLTKRLSTLRLGQEPDPFDMRFVHGANVDNVLAGDETAVVGGRTAYLRSLGDVGKTGST